MDFIEIFFSKLGETFCGQLTRLITSMLDCFCSSTSEISQSMAKLFQITIKSAESYVYRFLDNAEFVIGAQLWRCYQSMLFSFLEERNEIKSGDVLQINVDFTSIEDRFNILCASLIINNEKAVMLYFNMRRYPQRENSFDQKKMEVAFFNALKKILPTKYQYSIVGDRGFGQQRILEICKKHGFSFVLRRCDDLNLLVNGEKRKLKDFSGENCTFVAYVQAWKKDINFVVRTTGLNTEGKKEEGKEEESTWYLMTNLESNTSHKMYEKRFKIEKLFQDWKGLGFDLEKTKIEKEDRVKRLSFLVGMTHAISTFIGVFAKYVKKKYPNHSLAITAYSRLEKLL
jgi:hypothetical protein